MIIRPLKQKYYLNKFRLFLVLLLVIVWSGCSSTHVQKITKKSSTSIPETKYKSCSGSGQLQAFGHYKGKLKFTYYSQNDSTIIQFKDFMGRKTLIMWLEKDQVTAWDILKNRKYYHNEIITSFPILNRLKPEAFTKLLWGESPNISENILIENVENETIEISINEVDLAHSEKGDQIIFKDKLHNSEVKLSIVKRTLSNNEITLDPFWKMKPL